MHGRAAATAATELGLDPPRHRPSHFALLDHFVALLLEPTGDPVRVGRLDRLAILLRQRGELVGLVPLVERQRRRRALGLGRAGRFAAAAVGLGRLLERVGGGRGLAGGGLGGDGALGLELGGRGAALDANLALGELGVLGREGDELVDAVVVLS